VFNATTREFVWTPSEDQGGARKQQTSPLQERSTHRKHPRKDGAHSVDIHPRSGYNAALKLLTNL
jgi:hypothetical protein